MECLSIPVSAPLVAPSSYAATGAIDFARHPPVPHRTCRDCRVGLFDTPAWLPPKMSAALIHWRRRGGVSPLGWAGRIAEGQVSGAIEVMTMETRRTHGLAGIGSRGRASADERVAGPAGAPRAAALLPSIAAGVLALVAATDSPAQSLTITPGRGFAADSYVHKPLPRDAPADPKSEAYAANTLRQIKAHHGHADVNIDGGTPPLYIAPADQPTSRPCA